MIFIVIINYYTKFLIEFFFKIIMDSFIWNRLTNITDDPNCKDRRKLNLQFFQLNN